MNCNCETITLGATDPELGTQCIVCSRWVKDKGPDTIVKGNPWHDDKVDSLGIWGMTAELALNEMKIEDILVDLANEVPQDQWDKVPPLDNLSAWKRATLADSQKEHPDELPRKTVNWTFGPSGRMYNGMRYKYNPYKEVWVKYTGQGNVAV